MAPIGDFGLFVKDEGVDMFSYCDYAPLIASRWCCSGRTSPRIDVEKVRGEGDGFRI